MDIAARARSLLAPLLAIAATAAAAQGFPSKPVKVVVPFAAGGPADLVAREVAARLTQQLGQPFLVENQGGAMGKLAVASVARAQPDGYTLLFPASGNVAVLPLFEKERTDILAQLAPVSMISSGPHVLVVSARLPIRNTRELVEYARAHPGKVNFASAGTGGVAHLGMEMLKSSAGIDIVHVPYKGSAPAMADLASGEVQAMFSSMPSLQPMIDRGAIRAIGMTAHSRGTAGIPLISEAVPGFEYTTWYGLFAPAGTPAAVIAALNAAVRQALSDPALQRKLEPQGLEPQASTPEELAAYLRRESAKWAKVIQDARIRLD
jgi:tripartite-type tricarboxylate transporter receptor subunit TctC